MNDYLSLTLVIQDPCAEIRECFAKKLLFLIYNRKIHIRYLPILFLIAHEPEKDLRDTVKYKYKKYKHTHTKKQKEE